MEFERAERVSLKAHPDLTEKWVQNLVAEDPSILGLGDLELRQKERIQPRAGRLDLLLQDPDTKRRYEVELQLGATDETHIIRTLEYWDIERKRFPQYDHCAVLVAEDITARFLNVIALFNGSIPLIALQMMALKVGGKLTLVFTKVMDELSRGLVDEDEDAEAAPADRAYWEGKGARSTLAAVDQLFEVIRQFDPALQLRYNKHYIGIGKDGEAFNFVTFRAKRSAVRLELKLPQTDEVDQLIEQSGMDSMDYDARWGNYRVRLTPDEVTTRLELLRGLMRQAYDRRAG